MYLFYLNLSLYVTIVQHILNVHHEMKRTRKVLKLIIVQHNLNAKKKRNKEILTTLIFKHYAEAYEHAFATSYFIFSRHENDCYFPLVFCEKGKPPI